jgi:hypothetical protein
MAYEQYKSLETESMPTEVGPVIEVTSVTVRPGWVLPRHSRIVVLTGLLLLTWEDRGGS